MFKFSEEDLDEDLIDILSFLNEITELIGSSLFKDILQVDLYNLKDYLISILKAFARDDISVTEIQDIGEGLDTYIHYRYKDDYPETCYPVFEETDPLSVPLNILRHMDGFSIGFLMFPEDAPFFIQMLEAPPEQAKETNEKIYAYAEQFDLTERFEEARRRGYFTIKKDENDS